MAPLRLQSWTRSSVDRRAAFTLIELIIVIAIIAMILGLLLPALGGVQKRSRKTAELNQLKHVGHAWMLYANSNDDAALPGFLETSVQNKPIPGVSRGWGVIYEYPGGDDIPNSPINLPGPWPWRLGTFLDHAYEPLMGYRDDPNPDIHTMRRDAQRVAFEPAFGYNGFYLGGHWDTENFGGVATPVVKFFDDLDVEPPHQRLSIVTSIAQIRDSENMVAFCSATRCAQPGTYGRFVNEHPGWHTVMPPILRSTPQWQPTSKNPARSVDALVSGAMTPLGRHTGAIAVLYTDGHVDSTGYDALNDQRKWINNVARSDYMHGP